MELEVALSRGQRLGDTFTLSSVGCQWGLQLLLCVMKLLPAIPGKDGFWVLCHTQLIHPVGPEARLCYMYPIVPSPECLGSRGEVMIDMCRICVNFLSVTRNVNL